MVLEAKQLAAEAIIAQQRLADVTRFGLVALSHRFELEASPLLRACRHLDAGTSGTAHYTNMDPGEYSFQVIAANSYGIWNEQGAKLHFVLRPHFYQTSGFYALCSTTFLALLWLGYQFRIRQLQQAFNVRMEERVEERTRIARELHDTLLQSFQGLMFSFQAARNLLPGAPKTPSARSTGPSARETRPSPRAAMPFRTYAWGRLRSAWKTC